MTEATPQMRSIFLKCEAFVPFIQVLDLNLKVLGIRVQTDEVSYSILKKNSGLLLGVGDFRRKAVTPLVFWNECDKTESELI